MDDTEEPQRASQAGLRKYMDIKGNYRPRYPPIGHLERCRKRIRGWYDGTPLFDTFHACYVWENNYFPTIYVPRKNFFDPSYIQRSPDDMRFNEDITPLLLGYRISEIIEDGWFLVVDGEKITPVVYTSKGLFEGYVRIPFKIIGGASSCFSFLLMDIIQLTLLGVVEWKEEEDEIVAFPKDPYKRIDVHQSTRTISLQVGHTVLQSDQAVVLFQIGFPPRYYFTGDILKPKKGGQKGSAHIVRKSGKKVICPYKGEAEYFNLDIDGREYNNIAWSYTRPNPEAWLIKDRLCFSGRKIKWLKIEGVEQIQEPVPADYDMTDEERTLFVYDS
ncbi:hypothetical protein H072_10110 [Dactylellina haptotyla CBS 200.50]|uniref:DUF427 domain-containing protein n=1 Tax=Dactylellina haptotyla (strain CBS 200.50) TaxID=1284197 RepID=S8A066_DACHA|nr:hypothetical protein H072_10110 [Dactylellina haptotyla CBS 200.50]